MARTPEEVFSHHAQALNRQHARWPMLPCGSVIFVDYLGPVEQLERVREVVTREIAAAMRVPSAQVVVRRVSALPTRSARASAELRTYGSCTASSR